MITTKKVTIYRFWCKKCGICIAFCPKKVLQLDETGYPFLRDDKACTGCGLCELRCPDFALVMEKEAQPLTEMEVKEEISVVSGGIENADCPNSTRK